MRKFEAVLFLSIGVIALVAFFVGRDVTRLVQAVGFILVGISAFCSVARPAQFSDKVTWASLFRSPDKPWLVALDVIGWLLVAAGFGMAAFEMQ